MSNSCNLILNLQNNNTEYPKYFKNIYDKNRILKKKIFIEWIDLISKKQKSNIFWWSLNHVSKNNYLNNLYHNFVLLESVKKLKNTNKFNTIIIDENIYENVKKIKFRYKKKIIIKSENKKKKFFIKILKFFIYKLCLICSLKLFPKKKSLNKKNIIIDCFISNFDNPEKGFIYNLRMTGFINKEYLFAPTFAYLNYFKRFILAIKLFYKKNLLIKERYLNISDILKAFSIFRFAKNYNHRIKKLSNWNFEELVYSEMKNFDQFESIINSVLNYYFAKNLKKNNFKIKRSINYFENQNLDKGWNLGFNTFYGSKINIGYQAFAHKPEKFNHSPSKEEVLQKLCPKVIYVKGQAFIKIIKENYNKIRCYQGPSFVNFDKKYFNFKKRNNFLFLLTGEPLEDEYLIKQIFFFKENNKKKRFGIKLHPISNISKKIKNKLLRNNIIIYNDIKYSLGISEIVISAGLTTSLIEGLIYNCKLIVLNNSASDIFFFKNLSIPNKSYTLVQNLKFKKIKKLKTLNLIEKKKIIDNYYSVKSEKNVKDLLNI